MLFASIPHVWQPDSGIPNPTHRNGRLKHRPAILTAPGIKVATPPLPSCRIDPASSSARLRGERVFQTKGLVWLDTGIKSGMTEERCFSFPSPLVWRPDRSHPGPTHRNHRLKHRPAILRAPGIKVATHPLPSCGLDPASSSRASARRKSLQTNDLVWLDTGSSRYDGGGKHFSSTSTANVNQPSEDRTPTSNKRDHRNGPPKAPAGIPARQASRSRPSSSVMPDLIRHPAAARLRGDKSH